MAASYFPTEDLGLNIARGLVKGTSSFFVRGALPSLSVSTTGTIWGVNDTLYPWSAWATAGTLTIDRASASDAGKIVILEGLDNNFMPITEEVTLTNATGNASSLSYRRLQRATIKNGGQYNVGDVTIKKSGTTVGIILDTQGESLMCVYTIPADTNGYLSEIETNCQASADGTVNLYARDEETGTFSVKNTAEVAGAGGLYNHRFMVPVKFPPKTDLEVRVTTRSNNGRFTSSLDLILIKENLGP